MPFVKVIKLSIILLISSSLSLAIESYDEDGELEYSSGMKEVKDPSLDTLWNKYTEEQQFHHSRSSRLIINKYVPQEIIEEYVVPRHIQERNNKHSDMLKKLESARIIYFEECEEICFE